MLKESYGFAIAVLSMVYGLMLASACLNGKLSPVGASAVEGAFALACPAEAAIPVAGPFLASACPGEEAVLAAAVGAVSAQSPGVADAGAPRLVSLVRMDATGKLVHVGFAEPTSAPAIQRALLTPRPPDAGVAVPAPAPKDAGMEAGK